MSASPCVLIVEDHPEARDTLAEFLAVSGFTVATAADGGEGIAQAIALRPAIVLMDLAMPNVNGWEAAQRIKAHPQTAHIPVVVLSAYDDPGARQRARDAGCDAFLTKPVNPRLLANVLRQYCQQ